jgi:hypothetical protein
MGSNWLLTPQDSEDERGWNWKWEFELGEAGRGEMRWTFDDVGRWWLGGQGKRSAVCVQHDKHEDEDVYAYKRERKGGRRDARPRQLYASCLVTIVTKAQA